MPRGKPRMTQSGDPAQKIASVPGQRYGEGVAQQAMQQAMPAPDVQQATAPSSSAPAVMPMPPLDPSMVQEYLGSNNPSLLAGTMLPDQPVTAGLSTGPGPGRSAIAGPRTPTSRWLQRMAEDTGNPKWRRLAEQAGL